MDLTSENIHEVYEINVLNTTLTIEPKKINSLKASYISLLLFEYPQITEIKVFMPEFNNEDDINLPINLIFLGSKWCNNHNLRINSLTVSITGIFKEGTSNQQISRLMVPGSLKIKAKEIDFRYGQIFSLENIHCEAKENILVGAGLRKMANESERMGGSSVGWACDFHTQCGYKFAYGQYYVNNSSHLVSDGSLTLSAGGEIKMECSKINVAHHMHICICKANKKYSVCLQNYTL